MNKNSDASIIVKISDIAGHGVFATRDIKEQEIICIISGEEVSYIDLKHLVASGSWAAGDSLQVAEDLFSLIVDPYRFLNHSCDPNAFIIGRYQLVAKRGIKSGDEITFDYSATMWEEADEVWKMQCNCVSKCCRHTIDQFYTLPLGLQKKLIKNGYVQDYILTKWKSLGLSAKL